MTKANLFKNAFSLFFSSMLGLASFFPSQIRANSSETERKDSLFSELLDSEVFDGASQSSRYQGEKGYNVDWYQFLNPLTHAIECDMTIAKEKINDFINSAAERIETSTRYQDLVVEIFFRSTMMFRLAHKGYSTAYLKEFERVLSKLAELDSELKKIGLHLESRRSELDRVIEGSFWAGIDQLNSKTSNVSPTIREVLQTLADSSSRDRFKSKVRQQANTGLSIERTGTNALILAFLTLSSAIGLEFFDLNQVLEVSRIGLSSYFFAANLGLSRYLTNLIRPLKFKRRQSHIFKQVTHKCSTLLSLPDLSRSKVGGSR